MSKKLLLLAVPALFAISGCGYGDHTMRDGDYGDPGDCGSPAERGVIDTDATLEVEAGTGVGVFVEYQTGGRWHVFTSCDTEKSGLDCVFDIVVQPVGTSQIAVVQPDHLEREDSLSLVGGDAAELVTRTDLGFDGFYLETTPGVALSVDAFLDGACTNYVYWVGDGAVHNGAPTSPIEFEPSAE